MMSPFNWTFGVTSTRPGQAEATFVECARLVHLARDRSTPTSTLHPRCLDGAPFRLTVPPWPTVSSAGRYASYLDPPHGWVLLFMAPELKKQGFRRRTFAGLSLCFSFVCCAGGGGINVALHAQARASKEMVVGSAVTMAGLRQALLSRAERTAGGAMPLKEGDGDSNLADIKMGNVSIFYPFEYSGLHDRSWDLVIIEGWFGMINAFIHEVRALSHPRPVTILFYCLDPHYPGLPHVAALDVEGFLTNSESTRQFLLRAAPTALVPLAADTEAFSFHPIPPCPSGTVAVPYRCPSEDSYRGGDAFARGGNAPSYGRVVYVGAAGLMEYKEMLPWMLREAAPYGLDIYGSGWQDYPEFSAYWKGVLPQEDLAFVYGTALAVVGVTMDAQRESGKINNRVYEALSVGAPLISDHFVALEATFGDAILYARSPGDVARHIETLLRSCRAPGQIIAEASERRRRRVMIENEHTWCQRSEDILSFAGSLPGFQTIATVNSADRDRSRPSVGRCSRQGGCLSLAIVVDRDLDRDVTLSSTFVPAVELLGSAYRITWWMAPMSWDRYDSKERTTTRKQQAQAAQPRARGTAFRERRQMQLPHDSGCLAKFDIVWVVGPWGGTADRIVRSLLRRGGTTSTRRATTPRLTAQLTGLVLWGSLCIPATDMPGRQKWDSPKPGPQDVERFCPDYAGGAGLRWYDVVYCQTKRDYAFLIQQAFEGEVSANLQQAWGFGTARKLRFSGYESRVDEVTVSNTQQPDVLVVGTDAQLLDMLRCFKVPGVRHVVLAIIVPSGAIGTDSALGTILSVAGVDVDTNIDKLPQNLPLDVDRFGDSASSTPLGIEVLLIRHAGDADALARLASGAANVVIMAGGQLGTWATLLTTPGGSGGSWGKEQAQGEPIFAIGNSNYSRGYGSRIRDMIKERPGTWDAAFYSRRLVAGMTRAFCLGRGNSHISLVHPASGSSVRVAGKNGTKLTVEVLIDDFDVGRDGQWCITVQGRNVLCILQNEFAVDIFISSSASETEWEDLLMTAGSTVEESTYARKNCGEDDVQATMVAKRNFIRVEIATELRSNMYMDVLRRSKPFFLYIDPSADAISAFGAGTRAYHNDGLIVDWNETMTRVRSDGTGSEDLSAFQISVDPKDFVERGSVVALDIATD